jgi:hypothetical protein
LTNNLDDKNKSNKPVDEPVKKVKKLSETTGEQCPQNLVAHTLPTEIETEIKPCIEKLAEVSLDFVYYFISLCLFYSVNSI